MENKRKNVYITIFVITTIVASCVAVYFAIIGNKKAEDLQAQINEIKVENKTESETVKKNDANTVVKEEVKEETNNDINLSLDGKFVQDLYEKLPMNGLNIAYAYYPTKVTKSDISAKEKTLLVLQKMRESKKYIVVNDSDIVNKMDSYVTSEYPLTSVDKYSIDDVIKQYMSTFGENSDFAYEDVNFAAYVFEYDKEDKCFYGHSYMGGAGGIAYAAVLYNVEKNGDLIYLFDYYAEARQYNTTGNITNHINGSVNSNSLKNINLEDWPTKDELENYAKEFKASHKHTFKLNTSTGEYYWLSSEPLN